MTPDQELDHLRDLLRQIRDQLDTVLCAPSEPGTRSWDRDAKDLARGLRRTLGSLPPNTYREEASRITAAVRNAVHHFVTTGTERERQSAVAIWNALTAASEPRGARCPGCGMRSCLPGACASTEGETGSD